MCSIARVPGVSLSVLSLSPFEYWSNTSSSIAQQRWTPYKKDWTWPRLFVCVLSMTSFRRVLHLSKSRTRSTWRSPNKEIVGPWVRAGKKNRQCNCMLIVIFMRKHNTPATGRRSDQLRAVLLNEKPSQKSCMLNQMLSGTGRKQHLSNSICLLVLLWMNHFYTSFHWMVLIIKTAFRAEKQHVALFSNFLHIQFKIAKLMRMKCSKVTK